MSNSKESLRAPATLRQYISENEKSQDELNSRIDNLNAELDDVKSEMKSSIENLDDPEYQQELTRITSLRETAIEMLHDRQAEIEELNAELKQSLAKQQDEENFAKAVRLAQEAEEKRKRQSALIKEFDEAVAPILNELADIRKEREGQNYGFMNALVSLDATFSRRADDRLDKEGKQQANTRRKQLLEKIENEAGVPTDCVRLEEFMDWHQWNNLNKTGIDIEESTFGINGLVQNVERKRAQELERKKRKQRRELQRQAKEESGAA